jgi:hypothetical protein
MKSIVVFPLFCALLSATAWGDGSGVPDTQTILSDRQAAYTKIYQSILDNPGQSAYETQKAGQQILQSANEETDSAVKKNQQDRDSFLYKNAFFSDGRVLPRNNPEVSAEIDQLKQMPDSGGSRAPASDKHVVSDSQASASTDVPIDGSKVPKEIDFPGPHPKDR